jgi:hypothetical protein
MVTVLSKLKALKESYERTWYLKWFFPRKLGRLLQQYDCNNPLVSPALAIFEAYLAPLNFVQRWLFPYLTEAFPPYVNNDLHLLTGERAQANFNMLCAHENPQWLLSVFSAVSREGLGGKEMWPGQAVPEDFVLLRRTLRRLMHVLVDSPQVHNNLDLIITMLSSPAVVEAVDRVGNRLTRESVDQMLELTARHAVEPVVGWRKILTHLHQMMGMIDPPPSFLINSKTVAIQLTRIATQYAMAYLSQSTVTEDEWHAIKSHENYHSIEPIWDKIKDQVEARLFAQYGALYSKNRQAPAFLELLAAGQYVSLTDNQVRQLEHNRATKPELSSYGLFAYLPNVRDISPFAIPDQLLNAWRGTH